MQVNSPDKVRTYCWKNDQLVTSHHLTVENRGCFCVDTHYTGQLRYGKYHDLSWESIPLEDFPPEFRLNLLLLGVT
jgi:hypothetical protein